MKSRRKRTRKIRRLARQFVQDSTPVNVYKTAEDLGLTVVYGDIGEVSGVLDRHGKKILVNSNQPESRQRFAIAHEIGHYLLHTDDIHIDKIFPQRIKK